MSRDSKFKSAVRFLDGLTRDISAARLRVTLDQKLGRETPPAVKKLAALPYPPKPKETRHGND